MDYKYVFHEMGSDTEPMNPNVAKLGKMITDRVGVKIDRDAPEYFGLNAVISDEEAAVALKMGLRKPKTFEVIQKIADHAVASVKLTENCLGVKIYRAENSAKFLVVLILNDTKSLIENFTNIILVFLRIHIVKARTFRKIETRKFHFFFNALLVIAEALFQLCALSF